MFGSTIALIIFVIGLLLMAGGKWLEAYTDVKLMELEKEREDIIKRIKEISEELIND